jgi:hypothetical protein
MTSCITINQKPDVTQTITTTESSTSTTSITNTNKPLSLDAFIANPDVQVGITIQQYINVKATVDTFFDGSYYLDRPDIASQYNPHDLESLYKALDFIKTLPWSYERGYFDCSEMSSLVQFILTELGFNAVMVAGWDPEISGAGHAWVVVFFHHQQFKQYL